MVEGFEKGGLAERGEAWPGKQKIIHFVDSTQGAYENQDKFTSQTVAQLEAMNIWLWEIFRQRHYEARVHVSS